MTDAASPDRQPGPLLLAAIIAVPGLFCWVILRRGYTRSLRRAVFIYAGTMVAVGLSANLA